jgi:hypothetical protein
MRVRDPCAERVPPLILRAITSRRSARSAALFVGGHGRIGHEGEQLGVVALHPLA